MGAGAGEPLTVESGWGLGVGQIYAVAVWAKRVPVDLALSVILRSRVRGYLAGLPLDPEVRARVEKRVASTGFVDEIVPFVLALRDTYAAPEATGVPLFDAHLQLLACPSHHFFAPLALCDVRMG